MPLIHSKSKKAQSKNIETEMKAGKPQDQAIAISYAIKRKAKKKAMGGMYAEGGPVSAAAERRPMPDQRSNDAHMVSQNSGDKAPMRGDSAITGGDTSYQAKKGMKTTKIKHPRMVPQDGYSTRMRDEEDDLQSSADVNDGPQRQPPEHDNEEGADRQGPEVPDMEREHNNGRKPYAKGGPINGIVSMEMADEDHAEHPAGLEEDNDQMRPSEEEIMADHFAQGGEVSIEHDMMDQPEEEQETIHDASVAAAIMRRRKYAHGGEIHSHDSIYSDDSDMADVSRNADEDANEEDQTSFNALRKENYSETEGLNQLTQPEDSNMIDNPREDHEENIHDRSIVGKIRSSMRKRSPITR